MTVYQWVQWFTPVLIDTARACRHAPGDRWFVDETYVKVVGQWVYLYRAIDQDGQVIEVLVSEKRDLAATRSSIGEWCNRSVCQASTAPIRSARIASSIARYSSAAVASLNRNSGRSPSSDCLAWAVSQSTTQCSSRRAGSCRSCGIRA